jgi:hypothetical protein
MSMLSARLRRQDGFIRQIFWLAVTIAIVAVVLLDAMSLFSNHQSGHDNAAAAAKAARDEYSQTMDVGSAKVAAQESLAKSGDKLIKFSSSAGAADTGPTFIVTDQAHAHTYVFGLLRYVGLKKWVNAVSNPIATEDSGTD